MVIVLCFWERYCTLIVPLFDQKFEMGPFELLWQTNKMLRKEPQRTEKLRVSVSTILAVFQPNLHSWQDFTQECLVLVPGQ